MVSRTGCRCAIVAVLLICCVLSHLVTPCAAAARVWLESEDGTIVFGPNKDATLGRTPEGKLSASTLVIGGQDVGERLSAIETLVSDLQAENAELRANVSALTGKDVVEMYSESHAGAQSLTGAALTTAFQNLALPIVTVPSVVPGQLITVSTHLDAICDGAGGNNLELSTSHGGTGLASSSLVALANVPTTGGPIYGVACSTAGTHNSAFWQASFRVQDPGSLIFYIMYKVNTAAGAGNFRIQRAAQLVTVFS